MICRDAIIIDHELVIIAYWVFVLILLLSSHVHALFMHGTTVRHSSFGLRAVESVLRCVRQGSVRVLHLRKSVRNVWKIQGKMYQD